MCRADFDIEMFEVVGLEGLIVGGQLFAQANRSDVQSK